MKLNVWFNSGFSLLGILQAIRERENQLDAHEKIIGKLICTHKSAQCPGFSEADYWEVEPSLTGEAYVKWALEFATRNGVNRLVVGAHFKTLVRAQSRFSDIGVQLVYACSLTMWEAIDDKSLFYHTLDRQGEQRMLPAWSVWNDSHMNLLGTIIDSVMSKMEHSPDSATPVCVKPTVGVFGSGFFKLCPVPDPYQQIFHPEDRVLDQTQFEKHAHDAGLMHGHRNWMVMEYLNGVEYSVDCLAIAGKLISVSAREKSKDDQGQVIVHDDLLLDYCQTLARVFGLNGVFNAQFIRDTQGQLRVLEINPRFSGGVGISVLAGANLPWWWLKLTTQQSTEGVPSAAVGTQVMSLTTYVHSRPLVAPTQG